MEHLLARPVIAGAVAFVLATILTLLVRGVARKRGFVAKPRSDRWHKKPTAMMGGIGIYLATIFLVLLFVPINRDVITIIGASSLLFLVGLVDDLLNIKPYQKLIGQVFGAAIVVGTGLVLPLTGSDLANIFITVFWLVGITNAVNLLDNMDGLAAGIAAIAGLSLTVGFFSNGQINEAVLVAIFVGALVGFLVFNFNPASIFMGDSGSMFVGFLLASSVLLSDTGGRSRGVFSIIAVPVLILFVPIFDTTFVTIIRKMWGRKASQGGRDHTSHRLVALGLSERSAVLMIYGFAAAAGVLSLVVSRLETTQSIALIAFFIIVLTLIGVYLSKVKVYDEREEDLASRNNAVFAFIVDVSYKRRIFEVLLDVALITLAYYTAYVLLFGSFEQSGNWEIFIRSLPLLIVFKLFAFLFFGVYRGVWRYTTIGDLFIYLKAVLAGSAFSALAILLFYRFENFSRTVFFVDALLLFLAMIGSRLAFRMIRELLPLPHAPEARRVLIYGAGDGGEMVLRELRNNSRLNYRPVAFVDDDPHKREKLINGLKVYDGNGSLSELCAKEDIQEILISTKKLSADRISELKELCRSNDISLKRAELRIEPLEFE